MFRRLKQFNTVFIDPFTRSIWNVIFRCRFEWLLGRKRLRLLGAKGHDNRGQGRIQLFKIAGVPAHNVESLGGNRRIGGFQQGALNFSRFFFRCVYDLNGGLSYLRH